jgi:hypothetical protein
LLFHLMTGAAALVGVQLAMARTAEPDHVQRPRIVGMVAFGFGLAAVPAGLLAQLPAQPKTSRYSPHILLPALLFRWRMPLDPPPPVQRVTR